MTVTFVQEWKQNLQGYHRNIKLFFLFNFVWHTGLSMFGLVYNLYVKALGHEQTMVGNVVGMAALASAIVLIPAGILNDRIGPKRLASAGLMLTIASLTARALMEVPQGLLITAFIGGMSLAAVSVTAIPFLAEYSTPEQRVHLFSFNAALTMVASVLGNTAGGLITDFFHYGTGWSEVMSLRLTLLTGVGIAALGFIPVLLFEEKKRLPASRGFLFSPRQLWANHRSSLQVIGLFAILGLLTSTAGGMVVPYLNVYFEDRFDASKTAIGIVVSLGQAATAIAFLIGPMMARRFGEAKSVVLLQLSSIPFMLLTAYTMNFTLACVGYLFRQALMNAANPFQNSIKMRYVAPSLRGFAASTGEAVFNLGWFLVAPLSTGLVATYGPYYGYAYAFSITAVMYTMVSLLFYYWFGRERFQQVEEEHSA